MSFQLLLLSLSLLNPKAAITPPEKGFVDTLYSSSRRGKLDKIQLFAEQLQLYPRKQSFKITRKIALQ